MGQFDTVDLGGDKTMRRMIRKANEERNNIIEECATAIEVVSKECADKLRSMKAET